MNEITSFSNEFSFLSNFYECDVTFDGCTYRSVEHAYQSAKTFDVLQREMIRSATTAGNAKRLGRKVTIRDDWERVKLGLMRDLVHQKFSCPELRTALNATKGMNLIEGNHWNDTFWGVCRGKGQNWLGIILMEVRDQ